MFLLFNILISKLTISPGKTCYEHVRATLQFTIEMFDFRSFLFALSFLLS